MPLSRVGVGPDMAATTKSHDTLLSIVIRMQTWRNRQFMLNPGLAEPWTSPALAPLISQN